MERRILPRSRRRGAKGAALRRKSAAWLPGGAAQVPAAWTTAGPTALDSQSLGLAAHWVRVEISGLSRE